METSCTLGFFSLQRGGLFQRGLLLCVVVEDRVKRAHWRSTCVFVKKFSITAIKLRVFPTRTLSARCVYKPEQGRPEKFISQAFGMFIGLAIGAGLWVGGTVGLGSVTRVLGKSDESCTQERLARVSQHIFSASIRIRRRRIARWLMGAGFVLDITLFSCRCQNKKIGV